MPEQNLLIESVQAVHQHTDSLLNLLMKVCNKMSLSDITTECIQMSAALKDTKQIFTSLHESSSAAAAEHRVFEESMRKYAKEQATAESQGVESRLKTSTGKLEAEMKEKLKNLETRFLETDSGLDASSPRPKGDGNIKKVMNRISDFEAQVSSQLQAYTSDVDKKLSFLNSRRTTDEPDSIQGLSRDLDAVKYDVGELKDLLNGAKGDTAQVKRIVLACERDMEDFTAAMDAVNVDLDEMRARVDSTHSIITSRQRVEATVTAEISTMRLDMGDMQEALKAHDAWMEDVSQSLQEVHERCEYLNMEISGVNQNFQAKLDAKTDIASWNDMNDDIDASIRTVRDMASSLRLEVDSRRRRVDEDLLRMRSEVSSLDEKINSKTVDILRESSENNNALSRRLDERQEHCNSLEAMIVQHRQTSQEMQGKIDVQKEEMESRISSVHSAMAKQGEDLQRSTSERMESLEQQQNKGSKDSQKHLNAMDLRLAALQGATGECKRDIGKMRDEVNGLTVKSAAHDVDVAKNSDDIRKLERQRVEDDQRHKQEFDGIYDELDQKVTEKNFQRLEDDTAKLTRGVAMGNQVPVLHCRTPECTNRGRCDVADCVLELRTREQEEKWNKEFQLLQAVKNQKLEVVKNLISMKADVNARQPSLVTLERYHSGKAIRSGQTPLMCAASSGNAAIIRMLLSARAHLNDTNERGETALHLAASSGDINSVEELIKAQANPNSLTYEGDTVLDYLPREILEDAVLLKEFQALLPVTPEDDDAVPSESNSRRKRRIPS